MRFKIHKEIEPREQTNVSLSGHICSITNPRSGSLLSLERLRLTGRRARERKPQVSFHETNGGPGGIRTPEGRATWFTARRVWPLRYRPTTSIIANFGVLFDANNGRTAGSKLIWNTILRLYKTKTCIGIR